MPSFDRRVWFLFNRRIRGYKLHFLHGSFAWELQVGRHVFFVPYEHHARYGRFGHFVDPFGVQR